MKSNWQFALALLAVLVAVTAGLWWTRQSQVQSSPGHHPAPADAAPAPALPPSDDATAAARLPAHFTAVEPAEAPSLTAEERHFGAAGEFVLRSINDAAHVQALANETTGSPAAIDALKVATWRIFISGALQWSGTLTANLAGGAVLKSDEGQSEIGWQSGRCWVRRGDAVVPCLRQAASLVRALQWLPWLVTARPLASQPWQASSATVAEFYGQRANTLLLEHGPADATGSVAYAVHSKRILGAELPQIRSDGPEGAGKDNQLPLHATLTVDDVRPFGGALLASQVRVKVQSGMEKDEELAVRVTEVRAGGHVPATAPAYGFSDKFRLTARPGGLGLVFEVGSHGQYHQRIDQVFEGFGNFWLLGQFDVVEAFGPLGAEPDSGVQAWLLPQSQVALAAPGLQVHTKPIAAEPAVARKVVAVTLQELPAAVAKFLAEIEKAGHKAAPDRRTTARMLAWTGGDNPTVTAEIDIPIATPNK